MKQIVLCLVLIFSFQVNGLPKNNSLHGGEVDEKPRKPRSIRFPKACSTAHIDVRLEKTDFEHDYNKGIVRISLPRSPHPVRLCFPTDMHEHAQVFHLSHAICRQLGFMTLEHVREQRISLDALGAEDNATTAIMPLQNLKPTSWACRGYEQAVAQCDWNQIEVHPCHQITELTCGSCQKTFTESEGLIRTPGYPVTFLYQLTCEWRIEVPEAHTIYLVFDQFNPPPLEQSAFECANDKPYIELLYGVQDRFSVSRHCNFRHLLNLSIPFNTLTIRYFSGLYNPRALHIQEKIQGLAISFRAVPTTSYTTLWWLFVMTMIVIIIISFTGASCYYCRGHIRKVILLQKISGSRTVDPPPITPPNMPGREELERAYDFQRCSIQGEPKVQSGLRLRSTGSRSNPSRFIYPVSAASEQLTTQRKFSSNSGTPRSIIPQSYSNEQYCDDGKLLQIWKCKTNLAERLASKSISDSSVFLPVEPEPKFHIYHSESSDVPQPKPQTQHETML